MQLNDSGFWQYVLHHEWVHFAAYICGSAFIGGMPAPTKDSGIAYRWAFSSLNILASNLRRAFNTNVENSPNFDDAVKLQGSPLKMP